MIIGIPRETYPGEQRVALVPGDVTRLVKDGLEVVVESQAGLRAGFPDPIYEEQGARLTSDRAQLFATADVTLQVRAAGANPEAGAADLELLRLEQVVVSFLEPLWAPEVMLKIAERGVTAFAMELIPRISRAQVMDALSSMATVMGYKAVLLAANSLIKLMPMLMTAGGTITPARVFVVGAGVAGLQAIATARRLGAAVQAYDIRPAVKEEVESLGAKFAELPLDTTEAQDAGGYARMMDEEFYRRQRELMLSVVRRSDVVITTAAVPGKRPPQLITREMVEAMAPGSVIVDTAAEWGGNCELTRRGETVVEHGVTILGPINLASTVPYHASQLYSRNISNFVRHLIQDGRIDLERDDEILRETLVTRGGQVVNPSVRSLPALPAAAG